MMSDMTAVLEAALKMEPLLALSASYYGTSVVKVKMACDKMRNYGALLYSSFKAVSSFISVYAKWWNDTQT